MKTGHRTIVVTFKRYYTYNHMHRKHYTLKYEWEENVSQDEGCVFVDEKPWKFVDYNMSDPLNEKECERVHEMLKNRDERVTFLLSQPAGSCSSEIIYKITKTVSFGIECRVVGK